MHNWNYHKNMWACSKDGRNQHALANFCSVCGGPIENKSVDIMAPMSLGPSKESAVRNLRVTMGQIDNFYNVFGQPLLVDKSSGTLHTYIENEYEPSVLPKVNGPLCQIDFDRWWIYALTQERILHVLPTSALLNIDTLNAAQWKQVTVGCERIEKFVLDQDRLFLLDRDMLSIHICKIEGKNYHRYWNEEEHKIVFEEFKEPYKNSLPIKTMIPFRGSECYLGLVEKTDESEWISFFKFQRERENSVSGCSI